MFFLLLGTFLWICRIFSAGSRFFRIFNEIGRFSDCFKPVITVRHSYVISALRNAKCLVGGWVFVVYVARGEGEVTS